MTWHLWAWLWLAHLAVGGSLFLAVGCLAVRLCRHPVRRIRLIELTLVGSLLVPLLAQVPALPHWSLGWLPADTPASLPPSEAPPDESASAAPSEAFRPAAPLALQATASSVESSPAATSSPAVESNPVEPAEIEAPPVAPSRPVPVPQIVVAVYLCGAAALLLWSLVGMAALFRLCRAAAPVPPAVARLFHRIAGPAGAGVRLLSSERVPLPLAFGLWRPVIVLPAGLCLDGDEEALRYGVAHEWSHVERGDLRRWYLALAAQLFFYYQPLFWWLRRQLRLCQDYLADARAAEEAAEAEDYACYLVAVARRHLRAPAPALGMGDRRSNLYRRITMLLQTHRPLERRCLPSWSLAAGLAALGLLIALSAVRLDAGPPTVGPATAAKDGKQKNQPPAAGETLHYSGRVTDKDTHRPIAGVTVTVRRSLLGDPELKEYNPVLQETKHTTDAQGRYHFTIPPEQTSKRYLYIELDVEHPDYAPQKHFGYALSMIRKNEKLGGRPFFENVEMRAGKPVTGVVQTPEGKPAAGVKVLAYSVTDRRGNEFEYGSFADTRTDAAGKFRLVLTTPGKAVLWVLPEKYSPSTHAVKNNKRGDLGTFTMSDGIRLRGRVLDVRGKPLAGVNVNANSMERHEALEGLMVADSTNRSAVTNARGEFEMAPLPLGTYSLQPDEHSRDGSREDRKRHALPDIFVAQKIALKEGKKPEPVEVRAVPHVVIEARYLDSKGKPTRGHDCFVWGQMDKMFWNTQGKPNADGRFRIAVPHGLEDVRMSLSTNEHGCLRWRKSPKAALQARREIHLGTVNEDVKGIEIIRYVAPILVVDATDGSGRRLKDFKVKATYQPGKSPKDPNSSFVNGVQGDVYFEKQEDGRWRSEQMLPDEEVNVTLSADGYQPRSENVKLAEGTTRDLKMVLEREPAGKKEKK
jgi:beta-lactamase regulating signal transducer with metallopeptidase domain